FCRRYTAPPAVRGQQNRLSGEPGRAAPPAGTAPGRSKSRRAAQSAWSWAATTAWLQPGNRKAEGLARSFACRLGLCGDYTFAKSPEGRKAAAPSQAPHQKRRSCPNRQELSAIFILGKKNEMIGLKTVNSQAN